MRLITFAFLFLFLFLPYYSHSVVEPPSSVIYLDDCVTQGDGTIDCGRPVQPVAPQIQEGRTVQNTLRYSTAFTADNEASDSNNFDNWTIVDQTNATVTRNGRNGLVIARNVIDDGSSARAYAEFQTGPIWTDQDLSVCYRASNYNEAGSGTRDVSLQVVGNVSGTTTRTSTQNGIYCTVLSVTANTSTLTLRLGMGVTAGDTRTNGMTIDNVSVSPSFDGLPNEYVAPNPRFGTVSEGLNGASFNYAKNVSYNPTTGLTSFTVPADTQSTQPSARMVMLMTDSFGAFVTVGLHREMFWGSVGRQTNSVYSMVLDNSAGRSLFDTDPTTGTASNILPDMYALNNTPNAGQVGICALAQGVNDFIVEDRTAVQTEGHLDNHITWCRDRNMKIVLVTAGPFKNATEWTQAKENERQAYNTAVRAKVAAANDLSLVDYDLLLDVDRDEVIDAEYNLDNIHPNAAGYAVLGNSFDAAFKQIIADASTTVAAAITPSRSTCVSPCPVVFSAEDTTDDGKDKSDVFSQLAYHWDFDTDESDTYGSLYEQTYSNLAAEGQTVDSANAVGHVPIVTKTFLCETGTCNYNVAVRAQNAAGQFDDTFTTITVNSESAQFSLANTICVSNVLSTGADWTTYDKACPSGATKQSTLPNADQFDGKLVLLKKGETWTGDLMTMVGQDNFKVGYFGNTAEARPQFTGEIKHAQSYQGLASLTNPNTNSLFTYAYDNDALTYGWPVNNTYDGIAVAGATFGMSFQHATLHDVDIDRELDSTGGFISWSRGHLYCYDFPSRIACTNVPFPKGLYVSKTRVVGSTLAETNNVPLNVASIGCGMVNWAGITDSYFRKAGEHNLRVMGWYRFSIMASVFAGQHYLSSKQKISTRVCAGGPNWTTWDTWKPSTWADDVEGRTREDSNRGNGTEAFNSGDYAHISQYQATSFNVIGVAGNEGTELGGPKYQTNIGNGTGNEALSKDIIISHNWFENDTGGDTTDINAPADHITCISNTYADTQSCFLATDPAFSGSSRVEPSPVNPLPTAPQ